MPAAVSGIRVQAVPLTEIFCNFAVMKKIILSVATLLSIGLMGCDSGSRQMDYRVTCTLEGKQQHDSATLLVLEEDYNKLRVCGASRLTDGTVTFTGQIDGPRVALIRWDSDSVQPFHFVLEQGNIHITLKSGSWSITGSPSNSEYLHYISQRNSITDERVATWQEYLKLSSDKILKREDEQRLASRDSLLNDSLQRLTVDLINRGDAVGCIIRERYGDQLDQAHKRMLQ
jgi:hypothetical protein